MTEDRREREEVTTPYRPSNGTEGDYFMERWCDRCERERKYRETDDGADACDILARSMVYDLSDPEYPREWIVGDDDRPKCIAFTPEGDTIREPADYDDDKTLDIFEPKP